MPRAAGPDGLPLRLLLLLSCAALYQALHTDESILLAFKDRIENWADVYASRRMRGWAAYSDSAYVPLCTWTGISCDPFEGSGDQVTALELPCNNNCAVPMLGTLLPELANLRTLKKLDLRGNALYSTLPAFWGFNYSFPNLVVLNLNQNNLSGPVPDDWSTNYGFQSLMEMHLADNQLTGPGISDAWAESQTSWYSLMVWNGANNQFTGTLPAYMNGLITMSSMALQGNRIRGTLSPDWGRQGWYFYNQTELNVTQALEQFLLHDNLLTGPVPEDWGGDNSFTVLKMLTLGQNPLGSTLPQWSDPRGLPQLQLLNISHAQLQGTLPSSWAHSMPSIRTIVLDGNELSGSIPASWSGMGKLERVYVQPGSPDLCPLPPGNASFKMCIDGELTCRSPVFSAPNPACGFSNLGDNTNPPPAPSSNADPGARRGVPMAALAAPIAVGGGLAAASAGLLMYRHRRRRLKRPLAGNGLSVEAVDSDNPKPNMSGRDGNSAWWYSGVGAEGDGGSQHPAGTQSQCNSGEPSGDRSEDIKTAIAAGALTWSHPSAAALVPGEIGLRQSGSHSQLKADASNSSLTQSGASVLEPAGAFAAAPQPQWGDVIVQREAIEICRNPQGEPARLGGGASGEVYKAVLHGVTTCAVKVYKFSSRSPIATKAFVKEAGVLWKVCHPSIVQFLGASVTEEEGMLIMELMAGGDLASALQVQAPDGSGRLYGWWNRGRRVALQVANGLAYLHSKQIVHCDLKSQNVLLSKEGDAKIADVGFSRVLHAERVSSANMQGTFDWCAPEVLLGQNATVSADIYSLGILLWQVCTGELPRRGFLRALSPPKDCPPQVAELQLRCTALDPRQRPSAAEAVELLRSYQTLTLGGESTSGSGAGPARQLQGSYLSGGAGPSGCGSAPQEPQQAQQPQQQAKVGETVIRSVRMSSGSRELVSPLTAALLAPLNGPGAHDRLASEPTPELRVGLGAGVSRPSLEALSPHSISDPTPREGSLAGGTFASHVAGLLSPFELLQGGQAMSPFEAVRSPAECYMQEAGLYPWRPEDLLPRAPQRVAAGNEAVLQRAGRTVEPRERGPGWNPKGSGAEQLPRSHSAPPGTL